MQGFNMGRYVPPEHEGVLTGNQLLHPPRRRPNAQRSSWTLTTKPGQQMVRFEMPFAVWCASCPRETLIAQGVRFNAVKSRAGNYYTSPIWSFRMKHAECGGAIIIRTDPKNTTYVVVKGGRKMNDEPGDDEDDLAPPTYRGRPRAGPGARAGSAAAPVAREMARQSAFANLEKTIEDREAFVSASQRIERLAEERDRMWKDPYAANRALRNHFREGRHIREKEAADTGDLRRRLGGISEDLTILPESEEDRRRAALVDFGFGQCAAGLEDEMARPIFESSNVRHKGGDESRLSDEHTTKAEVLARRTKDNLAARVSGGVRKSNDPFAIRNVFDFNNGPGTSATPPSSLLRKFKKHSVSKYTNSSASKGVQASDGSHRAVSLSETHDTAPQRPSETVVSSLVDYASDSG